ncbi:MAG: TMEM175 family protein [Solirubrobacteraceae bacterium]
MQSFSDGVIAVAITLLVLGLKVPDPNAVPHHHLAYELGRRWPDYAAYVTTFVTIGIIWINHHAMVSRLRDTDHAILILNLLLLMSIGILPFATELMATYLRQPHGQALAAAIYSGSFLLMSLIFSALNRHILLRKDHLLAQPLPLERRRQILARTVTGLIPYALATALAVLSPYVTLAICAAIAVFYAQPFASGLERAA